MERQVKEETRIISEVEKKLASTSFRGTKLKNKIEMAASSGMMVQEQQQQQQSFPLQTFSNNNAEMSKLEQLPPEQFDSKEYMTKRKLETVSVLLVSSKPKKPGMRTFACTGKSN